MIDRPLLLLLAASLAGCAVGPDYHRPEVETPAAYKEAGNWKPAQPQDEAPRGAWWQVFGDPELDKLVAQVEVSNQNVRAAEAQYRQAAALVGAAQAQWFPTLTANMSATRAQGVSSSASSSGTTTVTPGSPIRNSVRPSLTASWEADIWGGIARNVEANQASAQASAADLQAALLSAQATLVQSYLQLRVNDEQQRLLARTIAAYERSLQITRNRYEAGVAPRVDVAQAEAQLRSTQAQAIDLRAQRAQLEHAIAVLLGRAPAEFSLAAVDALPTLPDQPGGLPSELLERRPDIAAAERRMAQANAQIGVAQAAFFPTLTLGASTGYQGTSLSQLFTLPNRFWSIGPALALTLFDAGARASQKEAATAVYDKNVATYRQTVLAAFQEVEDNLAALQVLGEEAQAQHAAAQASAEALALTENQYQAGIVSFLNVVTTQATALSAARAELDVTGRRLVASATLLKALGGGWRP
ncbi:MAG: efflux transporter outer membrane subunit [Ignavibacteria bacterium]